MLLILFYSNAIWKILVELKNVLGMQKCTNLGQWLDNKNLLWFEKRQKETNFGTHTFIKCKHFIKISKLWGLSNADLTRFSADFCKVFGA